MGPWVDDTWPVDPWDVEPVRERFDVRDAGRSPRDGDDPIWTDWTADDLAGESEVAGRGDRGRAGRRSADEARTPVPVDDATLRSLLGADRGPRWRIGVGAAVVLVLVALAATVLVTALRPGTGEVLELQPTAAGSSPAIVASGPATPSPPGAEGTSAPVLVHVTGAVATPGVFELPAGARVRDAVDAAGGFAAEADQAAVNLARVLVDGEQIRIPVVGEAPVPADPSAPTSSEAPGGLVDLNTATSAELEELPGIGPALAQRIIDYRDANGGFSEVAELQEVSGIGDATFAELEPLVTV